jgi:hypothetical protein
VSHQSALTVAAEVRPEAVDDLRSLLGRMGEGVANGQVLDFDELTGLHFARLVLLEASTDLKGRPLPATLLYMSDFDIAKDRHLAELAELGGEGIDRLFGHCVGYPETPATPEQRVMFLRGYAVGEAAKYVNTVGRTARQIRQEARLRDRIQEYLDEHAAELEGLAPEEVRRRVQQLVTNDERFHWARRPAEGLDRGFKLRELGHAIAMPLLLLILLPFVLIALLIYLPLLRWHERRDPAPHVKAPPEVAQELAKLEDHLVHNPFTAVGLLKPGPLRKVTVLAVLAGIDYATRHVFNRGDLAGVKTIHFARWVFLDGGRRVVFASNYDGSLENYMDDFIDKIWWGLNIVFSNGYGYPRSRFLVLDGCNDEQAFKDYLRLHQAPTRVWHSSYGRLSTANIGNNARIRAGLQGNAEPKEAQEWLRAL